jgi:hypothetical protein
MVAALVASRRRCISGPSPLIGDDRSGSISRWALPAMALGDSFSFFPMTAQVCPSGHIRCKVASISSVHFI